MATHPPRPESVPSEFEELLVASQRSLLLHLKSWVPNHHEAQDLLQKTNLVLWQKRDTFQLGTNFRAWAFSIARLEALNQLKQQRRDRRIFSDNFHGEVPENAPSPEKAEDSDRLLALQACIKELSARDRELLLMRYNSKRTLKDYAKNLNRSPGTLKARLFKIREQLRSRVENRL